MVAAAPAGTYSDDTNLGGSMEFWPEFLATSGGREFVAGGVGGMAGVLAGHPLDTLRIRLQQPPPPPPAGGHAHAPRRRDPSAARLLRGILRAEGPSALYRGMAAPLASVAFQMAEDSVREEIWRNRGKSKGLYRDVSSKDAPVLPELLIPKCDYSHDAQVAQSTHPNMAARAYYSCLTL